MPKQTQRTRRLFALFIPLLLTISACTTPMLSTQTIPSVDLEEPQKATPGITSVPSSITPIIVPTPEGDQNQPTETPGIRSSPTIPTPNYPESFYIKGIVGHVQVYELGCEASAAVDWANYFGKTIYEFNFQSELPVSDNPDFGYVGDPNTDGWGQIPPYAYGVHSDPVAELLLAYGLPAQSKKAYSLEEIREKISQSKPVIVWIIGNMEYSVPVEYIDSQGRKSVVAPYEHVVILTGYDQRSIRYMSNGSFYDVPNEVFLTSWGVLGNMAVVHE